VLLDLELPGRDDDQVTRAVRSLACCTDNHHDFWISSGHRSSQWPTAVCNNQHPRRFSVQGCIGGVRFEQFIGSKPLFDVTGFLQVLL
jgi:hypothetical protein